MIISRAHNKIVLNLSNPNRVKAVIPHAKEFAYKGHTLLAVPHALEEVQVLRNMGYRIPSPVEYQYEWSGRFTPFHAQLETTAFLTLHNRAFCLNDMGTGKTLSTLWAYDFLRNKKLARKLLVISPLSTLERTWADEIFNHFPHLTWSVLYGAKARRLRQLAADVDVYLINHDGIKVIEKELAARTDIDVVVIDEIASFRNSNTARWKCLNRVIMNRKRVWGLTGTPTPNSPVDAWAQCKLLVPERVPRFFGAFKDQTMRQVSPFKWQPRDTATQTVAEAMQPSIRFSRDQCIDLPPCLYQTRHVPLSPEQAAAYKDMVTQLYTQLQAGDVRAVNEAVKMGKLVQIAGGVVYDGKGGQHELPSQARLDEALDIIEQAGSKVIIYVPYKGIMRHVADHIGRTYQCEVVNGDTPKSERDRIFGAFQNDPDLRVLVAQPYAMSHGLTLTAANTIVWYAPITSQEIYSQANARVTRPGQKLSQLVVHIEGSPVERRLYQSLQARKKTEGILLSMLEEKEL